MAVRVSLLSELALQAFAVPLTLISPCIVRALEKPPSARPSEKPPFAHRIHQ